jgi:hypothetical protein
MNTDKSRRYCLNLIPLPPRRQGRKANILSALCAFAVKAFFVVLVALLLVGCDDGLYSGTLIFDGEHHFTAETPLPGDLLLRAGTAEFTRGSQVGGSLYVVGGTLLLDGVVAGDLVVLDGRVTVGPTAVIGGDLRYSGETVTLAETAVVQGQVVAGGLALPLEDQPRATGWDSFGRAFISALLLAGLGGLWVSRQPQPLRHISAAARDHWLASLSLGLLALLVLPILLVMMALTIVLLPLVLFLGLALFLTVGMGIITLGMELGHRLAAGAKRPLSPGWATFGGVMLLMFLFNLPVVGGILLAAAAVFLFGAVLLTRFGSHPYHPPLRPADDLATYKRPFTSGK